LQVRSLIVVGGVCVLALGASACGSSKKSGSTAEITGSTLTIYSSVPLQGAAGPQNQAAVNGAKLAVKDVGGKIGKYRINYVPLDDSTAAAGKADDPTTKSNAFKAVSDKTTVGYVGEYNSGATKISLPILNKGGIAQVSHANTNPGLTTNLPGSLPGEPDKFYPSGKRTYARVVPMDVIQGAAIATVAKSDGCKAIHIWNSQTPYSVGLAENVARTAKKLGITVEGNDGIDPKAANYRSAASTIKADCFAFTGEAENNGVQAYKDVLASHPNEKLYGGDGVVTNEFADPKTGLPANVASHFKGTIATLDPASYTPAGKKFVADYNSAYHTSTPPPYAIYGYEAMALVLDAVKRADAAGKVSRKTVVDELFKTKDRQSVLGTYSIDSNGDTTLTDYGLYSIAGGKLKFVQVVKGQRAAV
jgi:branched-chain amino acid transport system substrate-binding protein